MRKSRRKVKKYLVTNDNEDTTTQNPWDASKAVLRDKINSNTGLPQKRRKISDQQLNLPPKIIRKSQQREGNHKDQRGNQ